MSSSKISYPDSAGVEMFGKNNYSLRPWQYKHKKRKGQLIWLSKFLHFDKDWDRRRKFHNRSQNNPVHSHRNSSRLLRLTIKYIYINWFYIKTFTDAFILTRIGLTGIYFTTISGITGMTCALENCRISVNYVTCPSV